MVKKNLFKKKYLHDVFEGLNAIYRGNEGQWCHVNSFSMKVKVVEDSSNEEQQEESVLESLYSDEYNLEDYTVCK